METTSKLVEDGSQEKKKEQVKELVTRIYHNFEKTC